MEIWLTNLQIQYFVIRSPVGESQCEELSEWRVCPAQMSEWRCVQLRWEQGRWLRSVC